jgi:hypothetical protein
LTLDALDSLGRIFQEVSFGFGISEKSRAQ